MPSGGAQLSENLETIIIPGFPVTFYLVYDPDFMRAPAFAESGDGGIITVADAQGIGSKAYRSDNGLGLAGGNSILQPKGGNAGIEGNSPIDLAKWTL